MNFETFKKLNFKKISKEVLCDIENIVGNEWDVVKKEKTDLRIRNGREVIAENVDVDIKEKTVKLGPDRNHDELVVIAFNFNIEGSDVKVYGVALYDKYEECGCNENDHARFECVEINSKKSICEIVFDSVDKKVSADKKDTWYDAIYYGFLGMVDCYETEKNKERKEKMLMKIQGPIFSSLVNGTWQPYELKTEPNFSVAVEDIVAFGDFGDARKTTISTVTPAPGSTICFNINTVRRFCPGMYKLSVIKVKEDWSPIAVFHHELVAPLKIMTNILLTTDMEDYTPEVGNSLNRYDWCQSMFSYEDSDDDSEDCEDEDMSLFEGCNEVKQKSLLGHSRGLVFFTPVQNSESFEVGVKKRFQKKSDYISGAHQIFGYLKDKNNSTLEIEDEPVTENEVKIMDDTRKVSLGIDMGVLEPEFEWRYGAVFEDEETHLNFALVVLPDIYRYKHFEMRAPEAFSSQTFSKDENKFIFKMKDFA